MDNKKFAEELSSRIDVSLTTVTALIDALTDEVGKAASNLDSIIVPGFGSFDTKLREERVSVHPASGKKLLVPPRIFMTFKQSPVLKQRINHGK